MYSFEGGPVTERRPCQEHFQWEGGRAREWDFSLLASGGAVGKPGGGGAPVRSTWRNRRALAERALFSRLSSSPSSLLLLHSTLPSRGRSAEPGHFPPATTTLPPLDTHTYTRCKWPFSQPRRLLLSATHSHLVPLLFSSSNHSILAGSPPSVLCWQAQF